MKQLPEIMRLTQWFILWLAVLFSVSCVSVKENNKQTTALTEKNKILELNDQEIKLIDSWVRKTISKCDFLYSPTTDTVRAYKINQCLDDFNSEFYYDRKISHKLRNKVAHQFLDYYMGDKLLPHLNKLSMTGLTNVFNHMIKSTYAANPIFVKQFIEKGVSTRNVTSITSSSAKETCEVEMIILKNNIHLYRNERYLNNRQPSGARPKDLLFYQTANLPTNSHCLKVVELLIHTNPSLRDSRVSSGDTPLHFFMEYFGNRFSKPVILGEKLITPKNINAQDNRGRTPLHILLDSLRYVCPYVKGQLSKQKMRIQKCSPTKGLEYPSDEIAVMAKVLLKSGADVDIKDKKGVTARELMVKAIKLKRLL